MSQWSEPKKEVSRYTTETGGVVVITRTYVDHLVSEPFTKPSADAQVDHRELVNVEITGDISEEDATEVLQWMANGYQRPTPVFLQTLRKIFPT